MSRNIRLAAVVVWTVAAVGVWAVTARGQGVDPNAAQPLAPLLDDTPATVWDDNQMPVGLSVDRAEEWNDGAVGGPGAADVFPTACATNVYQDSFWYAGADIFFGDFSYASANHYHSPDDYGGGIRPFVGWESSSGTGVRGRWWFYGLEREVESIAMPGEFSTLQFAASSFDLDFYRRLYYDVSSFAVGVGLKGAALRFDYENDGIVELYGGGLGVFVEGRHPFYTGTTMQCAVVGLGRLGLISGRVDVEPGPVRQLVDTNMTTTELDFGLEIQRRFQVCDLVFQVLIETQRWENNMTGDIGFDGWALRFGGQW